MANKIRLARGTKSRIETIKETLSNYELVYSLDTRELGVKNNDGTVTYFGVVTELEWANILNKPNFATVATSGAYSDLSGRPNLDLKLDKNFTTLPNQATPLLTDVMVINRGSTVQRTTLGALLALVDTEIFIVVANLPATGIANKIYLVPKSTPELNDGYDEFIWKDGAWELLGSLTLDLSGYYNKSEVDGLLDAKVNANNSITAGTSPKITYDAKGLVTAGADLVATDIPNLDAGKITTGTFVDARIPTLAISKVTNLQSSLDNKVDKIAGKGLSTEDYTTNEKNKLDGIEAGAEVNPYSKTQLDGFFNGKVDKVSGKGLSTNDYTNTDKQSVEKIPTIEQDIVDLENDKVDKNNAITAGTKTKITYDSKGLVTGGANLVESDIPSLSPTKITQNATNRFVTDTQISTWNAKQEALGFTPENQANKKTTLTNSDVDFPTTKAVKTAIDTAISQTLKPMGNWNASTNTPTLLATDINRANQVWYVEVGGTRFDITFDVGDELVYNTNGVIFKRDNVDAVISVNGKEGVVVLTQDDVADGSTYKRVTNTEKTTWNNKVTSNAAITGATKTKITYDSKGLVTAGADLVASDIPNLDASKINAGTFATDRIPSLAASKINSGTFDVERIPNLAPSKITQNATNRFVTDTEKSTWNGKQEALPTITQAEINAGTSTTEVVITPKLLRDNFYTKTEIDTMIGDIESALDAILGV